MRNIVVFFRPDKRYGEFSNWYKRDFIVDGTTYNCMEQYMMHQKALLFDDTYVHTMIMRSTEPAEMKAWGRKVRDFDQDIWDEEKYDIIVKGLCAKFFQNEDLKQVLLDTGNKWIGECNKYDTTLGILASTTGNVYGIYDMSGGAYEYIMGNMVDTNGNFYNSNAGFNENYPNSKYYDSYTYNTSYITHERGKLGDATKEILKSFGTATGGWYGNNSYFPSNSRSWFIRGGNNMKLPDKVYDVLKWIVMLVLPAIATCIVTVFGIWNIPYGEAISGTIVAINTVLGAVIGISNVNYNKNKEE